MRPDTDCAKKKAAIHERKILTDWQLFSLKLLCLRCGQNFIIDQRIGLIKGFNHLGRFRMEIDFIQRFGFGRVPDSAFQDILVDACAITKAGVGKFTLVISGKQSPNIMKSILTACGMKLDGRTKCHLIFAFDFAFVFHFIKHIAHIAWASSTVFIFCVPYSVS